MPDARRDPGGAPLRWRFLDIVATAAGFGVVAGLAEVLVHLVRQRSGRTLFMAPEHVWQVPLADGLVFLALGLVYALVALPIAWLRAPRIVLGTFGFLSALAVLLLFERIHVAVEVLLALAIGAALARALFSRAAAVRRMLVLGAPAALLLLGLTGLSLHLLRGTRERRALASLPATLAPRPNILLLVLDTVRAWNLGLYGYGRATTPGLREWATRGVVFERTLAPAPWTTLSHAVMFTGRHPTELSVTWDRPLDRTYPTLAEALAAAGYATAGFTANYTQTGRPTGLARGFLHYADYPFEAIAILRRTGLFRRLAGVDRVAELVGRRRMIEGREGADINAEFLEWTARTAGRPWFAFLNYYEAHGPYLPPAPFDTMYFRRPAPVAERYWDLLVRAYGRPPVPVEDLAISLDAYDGGSRTSTGRWTRCSNHWSSGASSAIPSWWSPRTMESCSVSTGSSPTATTSTSRSSTFPCCCLPPAAPRRDFGSARWPGCGICRPPSSRWPGFPTPASPAAPWFVPGPQAGRRWLPTPSSPRWTTTACSPAGLRPRCSRGRCARWCSTACSTS